MASSTELLQHLGNNKYKLAACTPPFIYPLLVSLQGPGTRGDDEEDEGLESSWMSPTKISFTGGASLLVQDLHRH